MKPDLGPLLIGKNMRGTPRKYIGTSSMTKYTGPVMTFLPGMNLALVMAR